eukprot:TRINITY_DN9492_c0_g1_i1.p1 TRINITY_DN9492_c0_g1~~TRINITY_DN9492_c0_g1_i1.p1  ORF type:complete len:999 (-),score=266.75 TRINITY_DN9492_c0_g1_i1:19-3015(-)
MFVELDNYPILYSIITDNFEYSGEIIENDDISVDTNYEKILEEIRNGPMLPFEKFSVGSDLFVFDYGNAIIQEYLHECKNTSGKTVKKARYVKIFKDQTVENTNFLRDIAFSFQNNDIFLKALGYTIIKDDQNKEEDKIGIVYSKPIDFHFFFEYVGGFMHKIDMFRTLCRSMAVLHHRGIHHGCLSAQNLCIKMENLHIINWGYENEEDKCPFSMNTNERDVWYFGELLKKGSSIEHWEFMSGIIERCTNGKISFDELFMYFNFLLEKESFNIERERLELCRVSENEQRIFTKADYIEAIKQGSKDIISHFLTQEPKVIEEFYDLWETSVDCGNFTSFLLLLYNGQVYIEESDQEIFESLLFDRVMQNDRVEMFACLTCLGMIDIESVYEEEESFVHIAVRKGAINILKYLLSCQELNCDLVMKNNITPLFLAAKLNQLEIAKLLLKWQTDFNIFSLKERYTALNMAVIHGYYEMAKLLLNCLDVNHLTMERSSLLMEAIEYERYDIAELFLNVSKINLLQKNNYQQTILLIMCLKFIEMTNEEKIARYFKIMEDIMVKDTRVLFIRDKKGNNPIHYLCVKSDAKCIKLLNNLLTFISKDQLFDILMEENKAKETPLNILAENLGTDNLNWLFKGLNLDLLMKLFPSFCSFNLLEFVRLTLDQYIENRTVDKDQVIYDGFLKACSSKNDEIINELMKLEWLPIDNQVIEMLLKSQSIELVKSMLSDDNSKITLSPNMNSLLFSSLESNLYESVQFLLSKGGDVNAVNENEQSLVYRSIQLFTEDSIRWIELFIKYNVSLSVSGKKDHPLLLDFIKDTQFSSVVLFLVTQCNYHISQKEIDWMMDSSMANVQALLIPLIMHIDVNEIRLKKNVKISQQIFQLLFSQVLRRSFQVPVQESENDLVETIISEKKFVLDFNFNGKILELNVLHIFILWNKDLEIIRKLVCGGALFTKSDFDCILNECWDLVDINESNGGNMNEFMETQSLDSDDSDDSDDD